MKKITVTIHNGKIKTHAEGYRGGACQVPLQRLTDALQATVLSEEITAEGCLPEEPLEQTQEEAQHA
jgi:hypothetical protein